MNKAIRIIIPMLGWFAVITQYWLMLNNSGLTVTDTSIRFFCYFTILSNIIVAVYFTASLMQPRLKWDSTPVAVYITVVCLVYQGVLRPIWDPQGMQKILMNYFTLSSRC